jgi:hypothetical protein
MPWHKGQSGNPAGLWPRGHSGNPRGRPRRGAAVSEHLRWQLSQVTGEDGKSTRAAELARTLLDLALGGDVAAIRIVLERVEGAALPRVEPPDDGKPLPFTLVIDRPGDGLPELPPA